MEVPWRIRRIAVRPYQGFVGSRRFRARRMLHFDPLGARIGRYLVRQLRSFIMHPPLKGRISVSTRRSAPEDPFQKSVTLSWFRGVTTILCS